MTETTKEELIALSDLNKEELEKEAEEYAIENWEHYEEGQTDYKALKQAYLDTSQTQIFK